MYKKLLVEDGRWPGSSRSGPDRNIGAPDSLGGVLHPQPLKLVNKGLPHRCRVLRRPDDEAVEDLGEV